MVPVPALYVDHKKQFSKTSLDKILLFYIGRIFTGKKCANFIKCMYNVNEKNVK
jgi:hypothetical protein